jgi:hypothetical protein
MGQRPSCDAVEVAAWFAGRLPDGWFTDVPSVQVDRDEILVVGRLAEPAHPPDGDDARRVALEARISGFRQDTRAARVRVAEQAQARWRRVVSWGATCGGVEVRFTTASVPVMTRLRLEDRLVLDTLIDAGVARSRSEALAWCVRLVGHHQGDWIQRLRDAMSTVEQVRADGPDL